MARPIRLGVLLSGGGRTLQNIIDHINAGKLDAEVAVVISSRKTAYGLERARAAGIPAVAHSRKLIGDDDEFNRRINDTLDEYDVDLVVMAGFMSLFRPREKWWGRIMNIHPALLPSFCGKDMWGHHVHEAVIRRGCKVSGATVHFANEQYDAGPIILQKCVSVLDDDTPETLAARVFEVECELYPKAIQLFAEGRLQITEDGRVRITGAGRDDRGRLRRGKAP